MTTTPPSHTNTSATTTSDRSGSPTPTSELSGSTGETRPARRGALALSLAAVGVLALSACGAGGDGDSGIASIDDPIETEGGAVDPDLALADYQQCLRDNGADIDIQIGAGGGSISLDGGSGDDADPQRGAFDAEAFRQAAEACSDLGEAAMGAFAPDPQQQAAIDDAQLRFEECMADKGLDGYGGNLASSSGIDVGDSGGAADPQSGGSLDEIDPDVLRAALDECATAFDDLEES